MAEKKKKKSATEGDGTQAKEHKPNWREVYASPEDIKTFLGGRLYLRHNVITGRVECRLPFEVESIRSPRDHPFNYAGIYAQAYALYQDGFRYWFSQDEIRQLSEHNRAFETPRLETELVQLYFRQPTEVETGEFMSVARAMQIVSANISQKLSAVHLGRALSELGFRRVKYQGVRGYIVVCRKPDEMQMVQRKMAREASPDEWTEDSSGQCF